MKALVIIDKFKGTLSSKKLGQETAKALNKEGYESIFIPISDGGDGFLQSILFQHPLKKHYCKVIDAYGKTKKTFYLMNHDEVYIEVAKIIGLCKKRKPNILRSSSYGVGQVIMDAIYHGGTKFYIGLGGSMTNDGGKGMLEALGYSFDNNEMNYNGKINFQNLQFHIISDVTNPLLGSTGATYVFAKQKGAQQKDLLLLENKMQNFKDIVACFVEQDYSNHKGAGAAGGLGFAFLSVLKASYHLGLNFLLTYHHVFEISQECDFIITGEGKIDSQSLNGKVAFEILKQFQKPTFMVCGINEISFQNLPNNLLAIYSIVPNFANEELSMKKPLYCYRKLLKHSNFNPKKK